MRKREKCVQQSLRSVVTNNSHMSLFSFFFFFSLNLINRSSSFPYLIHHLSWQCSQRSQFFNNVILLSILQHSILYREAHACPKHLGYISLALSLLAVLLLMQLMMLLPFHTTRAHCRQVDGYQNIQVLIGKLFACYLTPMLSYHMFFFLPRDYTILFSLVTSVLKAPLSSQPASWQKCSYPSSKYE